MLEFWPPYTIFHVPVTHNHIMKKI